MACTWQASCQGTWDDGFLAVAYGRLWPPLGPWVCLSSALANTTLYSSELAVLGRFVQSLGGAQLPSAFKAELATGRPEDHRKPRESHEKAWKIKGNPRLLGFRRPFLSVRSLPGAPIVAIIGLTLLELLLLLLSFDYLVKSEPKWPVLVWRMAPQMVSRHGTPS